jgi:hypothetical protein
MAIVINTQPDTSKICSTLIPLVFDVTETTTDTTNIIASCYFIDQATGLITTQIGAKYRMAPNLSNVDNFIFDASEIFNTLTKYTLNDAPNNWKLGANNDATPYPLGLQTWSEIAGWKVRVKFQREYLDSTSGLIVLDPAFTNSNLFYIAEGSPEQKFLTQIVDSNGQANSVFDTFMLSYQPSGNLSRRLLTNYPMQSYNYGLYSYVTIHESEQYMISFFPNLSIYTDFNIAFLTFSGTTPLAVHNLQVDESNNLTTACVGFRDLIHSFTPSGSEGTDFVNVTKYLVLVQCSTSTTLPSTYVNATGIYEFNVDRSCIKNVGYLRFCFKNMLGGFDMVTSRGKYNMKTNNKFNEYEQSLGYYSWSESMAFGKANWANENEVRYSVKTQPMKPIYAAHFAEMFSSTQVYLREKNDSSLKINDSTETQYSIDVPYKFNPIVITAGTTTTLRTDENLVVLEFEFSMAVNQRNPRN